MLYNWKKNGDSHCVLRFYKYWSKSQLVTLCVYRYESGDHVAVFPTNDSALVNKLGQILGVDLDVVISLNNLDGMALRTLRTLTLREVHQTFQTTPPFISILTVSTHLLRVKWTVFYDCNNILVRVSCCY